MAYCFCFDYFDFMVFVLFHYLLYSNDAIIIYLTLKEKKSVKGTVMELKILDLVLGSQEYFHFSVTLIQKKEALVLPIICRWICRAF